MSDESLWEQRLPRSKLVEEAKQTLVDRKQLAEVVPLVVPDAVRPAALDITFQVRASIRGVEGDLTIRAATLGQLVPLVDHLRGLRRQGIEIIVPTLPVVGVVTDGVEVVCPKHRVPMRRREKQGDTWLSHNLGDEDHPAYCKGRPGKDSPGWEL